MYKQEDLSSKYEFYDNEFNRLTQKFIPQAHNLYYTEVSTRFLSTIPDGYKTIILDAQMGSGKTEQIISTIIREEEKSDTCSTLSLVFRVKLGYAQQGRFAQTIYNNNTKEKIRDGLHFTMYSTTSDSKRKREIRQAESLHKFDGKPPKILIVDECISFLRQMDRGCHRQFLWPSRHRFLQLLTKSKIVIFADAFMDERIMPLVKLRAGPKLYVKNSFQIGSDPKKHLNAYEMESKYTLIQKIRESIRLYNIIIITPSKLTCYSLYKLLSEENPDKVGALYTSETNRADEEMKNVNASWLKYNFIIYNGSIGAGISFDEYHFDMAFVLGDKMCRNTVEDILQMLARVRYLTQQIIYYYMPKNTPYHMDHTFPLSRQPIVEQIKYKNSVQKKISLTIENLVYHPTISHSVVSPWEVPIDNIWTQLRISHTINSNLTTCFFKRLFEYYLELNGHSIHKFDNQITSNWNPIVDETEMKRIFGEHKQSAKTEKMKLYDSVPIDETSVILAKEKILNGSGTLADAIIVKKHTYRMLCHCDLTGEEYYGFDIHYVHIQNYLVETCSHIFIEYYKNIKLKTEYTTFDRLFYMQELCFILGIKTSYDTVTFCSLAEFYVKYWNDVSRIVSELIIVFNKNLEVPETALALVTFLDYIFYNWTGSHLELIEYYDAKKNRVVLVTLYPNKKCLVSFRKLDLEFYKNKFQINTLLKQLRFKQESNFP